MTNKLYYGDNLKVLREHIKDESVDLIYLDPPFNSKRDYNLLFKTPKAKNKKQEETGDAYADAQITAFEDTWHWGQQAEDEFKEILKSGNTDVAELMQALRAFLKENDMMAYLTMMCNRLLELHRVLKPTGSLYLHCDPTASHYLKIVLDGVFGKQRFRTEISWRRSSAHNDARQGRAQYGNVRDVVLFYSKTETWTWNWLYTLYDSAYIERNYRHTEENMGRIYRLDNLTAAKPGGDVSYEFMGTRPYKGRYWAYSRDNMQKFYDEGRLHTEKVIVQVKGGAHVNRANIATLKGDVDREKAAIGLFITLTEPSKPMTAEAAAAGHYESPHHGGFPRIQILTIEGLLSGKERPSFSDLSRGEQTFKKARREEKTSDQTKLF
ncbi:MAG TPA: DNA methyltransferase [Thiobacillaceae bacterium]|nr:DNA methyltransferase [Thiobacillaceae bacterium]